MAGSNRRDLNKLAAAALGGMVASAGLARRLEGKPLWTVPEVAAQSQMLDRIQRAAFAYSWIK